MTKSLYRGPHTLQLKLQKMQLSSIHTTTIFQNCNDITYLIHIRHDRFGDQQALFHLQNQQAFTSTSTTQGVSRKLSGHMLPQEHGINSYKVYALPHAEYAARFQIQKKTMGIQKHTAKKHPFGFQPPPIIHLFAYWTNQVSAFLYFTLMIADNFPITQYYCVIDSFYTIDHVRYGK